MVKGWKGYGPFCVGFPVTKEISAHKRTDVLTDGLLHYAQHLYHKIGVTLEAQFARAETLLHDVSAKLEELTEKLPGCDDDVIQERQKEEVEALKPKEHGLTLQWDESYVSLLLMSKKLSPVSGLAHDFVIAYDYRIPLHCSQLCVRTYIFKDYF
ncbi:hypothetical protein AWC38_SpisGene10235 [Stylophora pistillata]|uniref:Uncharacterized protein n=1 Tax=Stylophora pistillata TaxID=50429 RepID=A0A2B4S9J6_STYPI|nr:hypothetical protein AWC38_SpisGene10235 [Stylophora pistillata]